MIKNEQETGEDQEVLISLSTQEPAEVNLEEEIDWTIFGGQSAAATFQSLEHYQAWIDCDYPS